MEDPFAKPHGRYFFGIFRVEFPGRVKIPLTCYRLPSALQSEMGQKWPKNGLRPHRGRRAEKWPQNAIFQPFSGGFSHFSAIFLPISPVGRKSIFRPFFPEFGPKARRQSVAGQRDLKGRAISGLCSSSGRSQRLDWEPSPPSTEPKIRKTGKSHFQSPKIPFFTPLLGPI